MKYTIYKLTLNAKVYIGYTSKGVNFRLKRHINLAYSGKDTYFYRAIRKYGAEKIIAQTLCNDISNRSEAVTEEKRQIKLHNSNDSKYGYNMTIGGDGGDSFSGLPENKKVEIRKIKSKQSTGNNNGRWSGYSDDELINYATNFFIKNKTLGRREWAIFCKENGLPQTFSKNRFNGKYSIFIQRVKEELAIRGIEFDDAQFNNKTKTYSNESREKISKSITGRKWYNDGVSDYQRLPTDPMIITKNLSLGRINANNKKTN